MDLGFAGLIDKIEERFGKVITNLTLASLLFLIFLWVIEKIFYIYVSGSTLWNEGGQSAIFGLAQTIFILFILTTAFSIVFFAISERIQKRAIQKVKIQVEKQIAEFNSNATARCKELRAYIAEWKEVSGE